MAAIEGMAAFTDHLRLCDIGVSLGDVFTLVYPRPKDGGDHPGERRMRGRRRSRRGLRAGPGARRIGEWRDIGDAPQGPRFRWLPQLLIALGCAAITPFTALAWPFALFTGFIVGRVMLLRARAAARRRPGAVAFGALVVAGFLGMMVFGIAIGGLIAFLIVDLAAESEKRAGLAPRASRSWCGWSWWRCRRSSGCCCCRGRRRRAADAARMAGRSPARPDAIRTDRPRPPALRTDRPGPTGLRPEGRRRGKGSADREVHPACDLLLRRAEPLVLAEVAQLAIRLPVGRRSRRTRSGSSPRGRRGPCARSRMASRNTAADSISTER